MKCLESVSNNSFSFSGPQGSLLITRNLDGTVNIQGRVPSLPRDSVDKLAYWLIGQPAIEAINRRDKSK